MSAIIDPRCPWVTVQSAPTNADHWELVDFQYLDPTESNGDVNVYIYVKDENGNPVGGIQVMQQDGGLTPLRTRATGEVDFNQSGDSSFDPTKGHIGAYTVWVISYMPSDKVGRMGLPMRHHVSYRLTFQKKLAGSPPPPPPGGPDLAAIAKQLRADANDLIAQAHLLDGG